MGEGTWEFRTNNTGDMSPADKNTVFAWSDHGISVDIRRAHLSALSRWE